MAITNQFVSLQQVLRAGIVNDDGQPTKEFLMKLQEFESKLNGSIDLLGQIVVAINGVIADTATIQGRSEGIGTTVQHLDATGSLKSLTNVAADRNLSNIDDSQLRKAVTVEQLNYVAVASVTTSGQSGTSRPTNYSDLGNNPVTNPRYAYDEISTSYAEVVGSNTDGTIATDLIGTLQLQGFPKPTASLSAATLNVATLYDSASSYTRGEVQYSLDGGLSWTVIYNQTAGRAQTTDSVVLLVGQDFSKVLVKFSVTPTAHADDGGILQVYDCRIDYTLA